MCVRVYLISPPLGTGGVSCLYCNEQAGSAHWALLWYSFLLSLISMSMFVCFYTSLLPLGLEQKDNMRISSLWVWRKLCIRISLACLVILCECDDLSMLMLSCPVYITFAPCTPLQCQRRGVKQRAQRSFSGAAGGLPTKLSKALPECFGTSKCGWSLFLCFIN